MTHATDSTLSPLERAARRRVQAKLGWYVHALVYVCVNAGLALVAWQSGRHWAMYPLLGWGLGLALHGAAVWLLSPGSTWRDNMVARELAALERQQRGGA